MIVRPAEPRDAEAWLGFRIELFPGASQERAAEIENYFGEGQFGLDCALVAEIDERLVGFAELSVRPWAEGCSTSQIGYLEGWYVAPDHRRSGVGRGAVCPAQPSITLSGGLLVLM